MTENTIIYKYSLYSDKINGYTLVYNPLSTKGVIMLDKKASALLKLINNKRAIKEIYTLVRYQYDKVYKKNINSTIENFISNEIAYIGSPVLKSIINTNRVLKVWFHITNKCNFRCKYCFLNKTSKYMGLELAKKAVLKTILDAKKHGFEKVFLVFAGGEPLLEFKKIVTLVEYGNLLSKKTGIAMRFNIITNGVLITKEVANQIKKNDIGVSISLDGLNDYHNSHRIFAGGLGTFKFVERGILQLQQSGVKIHIGITITSNNIVHMPDLTRFLLKSDMYFSYNLFKETSCNKTQMEATNDDLIKYLGKSLMIIYHNPPPFNVMNTLFDTISFKQPKLTCSMGTSYITIKPDGQIASCPFIIERSIGSINEDIINTMQKGNFIKPSGLTVEGKNVCNKCQWKYICHGGCPIHTFQLKGTYATNSPYCKAIKMILPLLLKIEGKRIITENKFIH